MQTPEPQEKLELTRKKKQQLDRAKDENKRNRAKRKRIEKKVRDQVDFLDEDSVYVGDTSHAHDPAIHIVNQQKLPLNTREKKKIMASLPKQDNPEQLLDTLRQESKTKKKPQKKKKYIPKEEEVVVISSSDEDERPPKKVKMMQLPTDKTLVIATDSDDEEIPPVEIATAKTVIPKSKTEIEQPTTPKHVKFMNGEAVPFARKILTSPPSSITPTRLTNLAREFHRNMVGRYFIANTNTATRNEIDKPSSLTLGTKDNFSQVCCACANEDHDVFDCQRMFCTLCTRTGHRAMVSYISQ
jgi:hypothetical protein